jgi:ABC-type Mn2+/Zn2+ transport system ATPase subunit
VNRLTEPTAAIALNGVTVGYRNTPVLTDVTLTVQPGEFVGIVGPSGAGKTTLLKLFTGGSQLLDGRCTVNGVPFRRGKHNRPHAIAYVPQLDTIDATFPLTAHEVVLLGGAATSRNVPWFSRDERHRATDLLDRLGIAELAYRPVSALSGGQRQRMFVARALFHNCSILLLDEPTSGVDLATRAEMLTLLGELHHDGLTVLITTHDLNFVAAHLPRIVCINGAITADGKPADILQTDVLKRTFGHTLTVLDVNGRPVIIDPERIALHSALAHKPADQPAPDRPAPVNDVTAL